MNTGQSISEAKHKYTNLLSDNMKCQYP